MTSSDSSASKKLFQNIYPPWFSHKWQSHDDNPNIIVGENQ